VTTARDRFRGIGLIEWFPIGDEAHVEDVLRDLRALKVPRLRTQFSWADWHTPRGEAWYDWLLPRLAAECEVLPCFTYTPPSLGIEPRTSSPPRDTKAYADFLDVAITRLGQHFEWVELWNEPNNLNDWDWHLDHDWTRFADMIVKAAYWARQRGKKTVLAGMCPTDPNWLSMMAARGALADIDAVGIHGFPGTWDFRPRAWDEVIGEIRGCLQAQGLSPEVWLTEVGYSTWRHDEIEQVRQLREALDAPVERIYWYGMHDLQGHLEHQDGFHEDERHYHFGLRDDQGRAKLLHRIWAQKGFDGIEELARLRQQHSAGLVRKPAEESIARGHAAMQAPAAARPAPPRGAGGERPTLITGGAGFVGTNLAARLLAEGKPVLVYDNLSRPGVEHNLRWLRANHGSLLQVEVADVRDQHLVRSAVAECDRVFHFAAQVAVTSSLDDPRADFDINLLGTLNVLEAVRRSRHQPPLVFTSTNKVYGASDDIALEATAKRYQPSDPAIRDTGIGESRPLDFHSPYGCSKGGADQYVLDYVRSFDLRAVVLRMSCIYGPHQFGNEDQGWVAHFLIRALEGHPITIYGDGRQVRDVLFVEDLVDAMLLCQQSMDQLRGRAFNIGGGPANTTSLLELLERIGTLTGDMPEFTTSDWRTGDQRYYVSDIRGFSAATGWRPQVGVAEGVQRLHAWLQRHADATRHPAQAPVHAA
jgi:CDP-paratose 2-epimerase